MNFLEILRIRQEEAQQAVYACLPEVGGYQKTLLAAMDYSMRAGGKRIRPVLMQAACELYGGEASKAYPFMAAMEMIHTHSLIHDDLPAMDNDLYRRGKKTTHAVFGEGMAVLAGDGLLNLAYETAAGAAARAPQDAGVLRSLCLLAKKTGINGMIGGQSLDVEKDGQMLREDELDFIYRLKTAALIEGSLMIGASLAGAGDPEIAAMEQLGHYLGMAFQIRDDILDVEGDSHLMGKSTGSDAKNGKTTYVSVYGMQSARDRVRTMTEKAKELLAATGRENEAGVFLAQLADYLADREK